MNVTDYEDYKIYLREALDAQGRGARTQFCKTVQCFTAYLSQVLYEKAHLSLEQAERASHHFGHRPIEHRYFLHLVMLGRAGTPELRNFFQSEVQKIKDEQSHLLKRLKHDRVLNLDEQAQYYSQWLYSAVHVALSIPSFGTSAKIARHLNIEEPQLNAILGFLLEAGLIEKVKDSYRLTQKQLFIGREHPQIKQHHTNWRLQAIQSLTRENPEDLHYSGVIALASKDIGRVREIMIRSIEEIRTVVRESPEEKLAAYTLDLFRLI